MGYARSPFRDFGSYLRIIVGLDEDYIQLISKQYNRLPNHSKWRLKENFSFN